MDAAGIGANLVQTTLILTPESPGIHGFKTTESIDHIVKNIIRMELNSISSELVKNIACVRSKTNTWTKESPHLTYFKLLRKHEAKFGSFGPLGINGFKILHTKKSSQMSPLNTCYTIF